MTNVTPFPSKANVGKQTDGTTIFSPDSDQIYALLELQVNLCSGMNADRVSHFFSLKLSPLAKHLHHILRKWEFPFMGLCDIKTQLEEDPFVPCMDAVIPTDEQIIEEMKSLFMISVPDSISIFDTEQKPVKIWITHGYFNIQNHVNALLTHLSPSIGRGCITFFNYGQQTMSEELMIMHMKE